jgi:hypothetical protein
LIKLLFSGNQNILFIIIAWSLLAFVGYNVLTVQAEEEKDCSSISEPDDDFYCKQFDWSAFHPDRESVKEWCGASEDYAKNPKNCDKAYDLVEKIEEKAAQEDAICDNEDAYTTDIELCMSAERKREKVVEETCNEVDGKMTKEGCDVGGGDTPKADRFNELLDKKTGGTIINPQSGGVIPFQTPPEPVEIEDYGNTVTVSDEEQKRINAEAQYQQDKYEQLADSSTNPGKVIEQILAEEENEQEGKVSEQEEEEIAEYNEEDNNQVNRDRRFI